MLEGDTVKKKRGVWRAPPERQQFGGHLLYRKENVVHISGAPEGTAFSQNDTHMDNKPQESGEDRCSIHFYKHKSEYDSISQTSRIHVPLTVCY